MPIVVDALPAAAVEASDLRVVELSPGGRPVTLLDLEDVDTTGRYRRDRDTFVLTPPGKRPRMVQLGGRFGGQRAVGEGRDNGAFGATWRVRGLSADDALANAGALVGAVDSAAGTKRYLAWRARNAGRESLLEIRGPGNWTPKYSAIEFEQLQALTIEASWPTAPYVLGLPLDIEDDFSIDTLEDYDPIVGSVAWQPGELTASSSTLKVLRHAGRGYSYKDVQVAISHRMNTTAPASGYKAGVVLIWVDDDNYISAYREPTQVKLEIVVGGTVQTSASIGGLSALVAGTDYWLVGRREGNVLFVEHWDTDPLLGEEPEPLSTAYMDLDDPLFDDYLPVFGDGGETGIYWQPSTNFANARITSFKAHPFTYRTRLVGGVPVKHKLPGTFELSDIPGDLPAICDLHVASTDGTLPFALFGWAPKPAEPVPFDIDDSVVPLGPLLAEDTTDSNGWISGSDATGLSGTVFHDTTPQTDEDYYKLFWLIDPSALAPEDFTEGDVLIEAWVRVKLDASLVSPRLTLSAYPQNVADPDRGSIYTADGPRGKLLPIPSADGWRFLRLGTLAFRIEGGRAAWALKLAGKLGAGSAGSTWAIDYLFLNRAAARVLSPTGKPLDGSYPSFIASTDYARRIIRSDGRGYVNAAGQISPGSALGGAPIELGPGPVNLAAKLSNLVPDDPVPNATSETAAAAADVHVAVQPRYSFAAV